MQFQLDMLGSTAATPRAVGGGLEGAERTSRETFAWRPAVISPDRQINPVKDEADARGRDTVQNDGFPSAAVHLHRDSIVGAQYRLNAQPEFKLLGADESWAEEFQIQVETRFNLIADSQECYLDAARKMTLTNLLRLAVGSFLTTGEILATCEWLRQRSRPWSTAIQMVSPHRLSNPNGEADTKDRRRGVELNMFGEALAYWIKVGFPNDFMIDPMSQFDWKRVEARKPWGRRQVIHIYDPLQPNQTRGIADMVSALKQMRMSKKFSEVVLQNAIVNASYAAAIESELPKEIVFAQMGAGGTGMQGMLQEYMTALTAYSGAADNIAIDGVKMPHLFPGTKLNLKPLGTPGGIGSEFEASLHRHAAAALGLSYEEYTRDFTHANYSSLKAGLGQTHRFMQGRKKIAADTMATMIYHLVLEEMINANEVPLPPGFTLDTFYNDPIKREALGCCEWIGANRGQVDEMKETQAAILRIKAGLSTWEKECARLGEDYRRIFRQRARENKMMEEMELVFDGDATKPGENQEQATMTSKNDA